VANSQNEIDLPDPEAELSEIELEARRNESVLRLLAFVIDEEIGRKQICWALQIGEQDLSKRLSGADNKRPCFRILAYAVRHEREGRLARLLMKQAGYAPPRRPDDLTDGEFRVRAEEEFRRNGPAGAAIRAGIFGKPIRKVTLP
jgi:hypothetical protein